MTQIRVGLLDPSHKNLGTAVVLIDTDTFEITPQELCLFQTTPENKKTVRRSSDDLRRAREFAVALRELEPQVDLFISEIPSGSQSARASLGTGVCFGLLAMLNKPLIEVTPTEAKKASVGRATATKDEIIDWAFKKYPDLNWIKSAQSKRASKLVDANEHLADAIAIGHAGVKTSEFRAAAAMLASATKNRN